MPTLEEVQAQTNLLLLQREERKLARLTAAEQTRQLLEASWDQADPYYPTSRPELGFAANDLYQHGGFGWHTARPGSRRHGDCPPFYRTEQEHWLMVDAARILEGLCPTAANILDVLTQFAIFTGFAYTAVLKDKPEKAVKNALPETEEESQTERQTQAAADDPLVTACQDIIDQFIRLNDWWGWEQEIFRRTRRDGEAFLYLEPDDVTGLWRVRSIEPEQIKMPQDSRRLNSELGTRDQSWKYGILTGREDTTRVEGYWVVSNYNDQRNLGEYVPAEEMVHIKTEWVDRQAKRGISDFFSVANDIHSTRKLLRNLREGAAVQAAIAWIREHPEDMSPIPLGPHFDAANRTRSGNTQPSVTYDGPTMLDVSAGMKYTAGPMGQSDKSGALIQALQAALRGVGARWQMPEALVSGDSSNANLASALVAEGPFVRAMTYRQWHYRCQYKRIMERLLEYAAATGKLPGGASDSILDKIDVNVECPPVIARKASEETDRNRVLYANGIMSKQTWSAREDLDWEEEKANLEQEPADIMGDFGEGENEEAVGAGKPTLPEGEDVQ